MSWRKDEHSCSRPDDFPIKTSNFSATFTVTFIDKRAVDITPGLIRKTINFFKQLEELQIESNAGELFHKYNVELSQASKLLLNFINEKVELIDNWDPTDIAVS